MKLCRQSVVAFATLAALAFHLEAGETTGKSRPVADSLIARWTFDRVENGTVIPDAAGKNHDAIFFSRKRRSPKPVPGVHGQAVRLAGSFEEGFTVPNPGDLNLAGPFTVMAWIRPERRNATFAILCLKGDKSGPPPWPGWRLRFSWTRIVFEVGTPEGGQPRVLSPSWSVPPKYWSHVAATWDGKNLRVFVNAVEKGTSPFAGSVAPAPLRRALILGNYIGRKNAYAFSGCLDDIRIYTRCLNAGEIFAAAADDK